MNIDKRKKNLIKKLRSKKYREAFVSEHIDTGIPFQILALRNQRGWSQIKLGENVDKDKPMKQEQISRLEDPNYSKFSLATLKRLASAFQVGLMVRFVPISVLAEWELGLTSDSLKAVSFDEDDYFKERPEEIIPIQDTLTTPSDTTKTLAEYLSGTAYPSRPVSFLTSFGTTEAPREDLSGTVSGDSIILPRAIPDNQTFVSANT